MVVVSSVTLAYIVLQLGDRCGILDQAFANIKQTFD
jgi:hypothetical protein